jgi:hypothetical protein
MQSAWIVPRANVSTLCRLTDGGYRDGTRMVDVKTLPMPPGAPHALAADGETLAYADGRTVRILRNLQGAEPVATRVKLPFGQKLQALALHDDVIYTGGIGRKALGCIDLRGAARWTALEPPPGVGLSGKSIDGFAIAGQRLVVVDDRVMPRYFLVYDLAASRVPRPIEARPFPWSLTFEHVAGVASDFPWMVVLSRYMNHGYSGAQVALVHLDSLRAHAALWTELPGSFRKSGQRPVDIGFVALAGHTLLLATGEDGLGYLDIREWVASGPRMQPVVVDQGGRSWTEEQEAPVEIPLEAVRFLPIAAGAVRAVTGIDSARAFATVGQRKRRQRLDTVLVNLP